MSKIRIIGAGLSGLVAGAMLRTDVHDICEAQSELPDNHGALLRFRSSAVADATMIPFRKVKVGWCIYDPSLSDRSALFRLMNYTYRCTGEYSFERSISRVLEGLTTANRYIAPADFTQRLRQRIQAPIDYARDWNLESESDRQGQPVISTIPMQAMMRLLDYPRKDEEEFADIPGLIVNLRLPKDLGICASAYVISEKNITPTRVSITGDLLQAEFYDEYIISEISHFIGTYDIYRSCLIHFYKALGIELKEFYEFSPYSPHVTNREIRENMKFWHHIQQLGKITPINERLRKEFITWATKEHNVYSLGRYATWRPGLLLDDVVQDVRRIQEIIRGDRELIYEYRRGA